MDVATDSLRRVLLDVFARDLWRQHCRGRWRAPQWESEGAAGRRAAVHPLRRRSLTLAAQQPRRWAMAEGAASMPPGAEWMAGGASPTGRSTPSAGSSPISGTSPFGSSANLHDFWGASASPAARPLTAPLAAGMNQGLGFRV